MKYEKTRRIGAYAEKHAGEIRLYKEGTDYFKAVMNGRQSCQSRSVKKELTGLTTEKHALCDVYYQNDDESRSLETLRRGEHHGSGWAET